MQYAQMICSSSQNIGDDIQSIAAARMLPRIDCMLDRDELTALHNTHPVCLIMNGWFMRGANWPPSDLLRPAFVGFHVRPDSKAVIAKGAAWMKRFGPIGARDRGTADFLRSLGLASEISYCLTLTLPKRKASPTNGRIVLVDLGRVKLPRSVRSKAVRVSHDVTGMSTPTKLKYAEELLSYYRDTASLVVTRRLHCALPCIAMGIPVVFFGNPADYRTSIVSDIGGHIYNRRLHENGLGDLTLGKLMNDVDWSPAAIDVTVVKGNLIKSVQEKLRQFDVSP